MKLRILMGKFYYGWFQTKSNTSRLCIAAAFWIIPMIPIRIVFKNDSIAEIPILVWTVFVFMFPIIAKK